MQWMNMREFLRGGYRGITEITVVANHGRPVFTVMPTGSRSGEPPTTTFNATSAGLPDVQAAQVDGERGGEVDDEA